MNTPVNHNNKNQENFFGGKMCKINSVLKALMISFLALVIINCSSAITNLKITSDMDKARALESIKIIEKETNQHKRSVASCKDFINNATGNYDVIVLSAKKLAEIRYNSMLFLTIAKCASETTENRSEFLKLIEKAEFIGVDGEKIMKISEKLAKSQAENELSKIRTEILKLN